ncbi:uncharacterized protein LOC143025444 [Oratosquilla oratoria]|uniref:uncharacterized protein LOC143025444 n=1 Tax=Oratosquilla oratoria TaxID=337810 RepID=UPI003F7674BE
MNRVSGRNGPGIDANWYLRQFTPNVPFVNPSGCFPLAAAFSLASNSSLSSQLTLPPPFTNQLSANSTDPVLQWLQTQSPGSALRFCLSSLQQNLMSSEGGDSCGRENPAMQNNLNFEKNDKSCRKKPSSRGTWSVFQCKSCSELFISKSSWLKHCFYHCKYHLTCQVCHLKFATRPELSLHVTSMKHSKMFRYSKCTVTQSEYDQLRQKEDSDNNQSQKVNQISSNQHRSDAEKTNNVQQLENVMWNTVDEELYDPFIQEDDVDSPGQNCTLQKTSSADENLMNMDEWGTGVEKRKWDEERGDSSVPKKLKENGCDKVYSNYNRRNSETALQAPVIDCNLGSTFLGSSVPPGTTMEHVENPANCYPSCTTDISWPSTVSNNVSIGPAWHCNTPEIDRTGALLVSSQQQLYPNTSVWSAGMKPDAPAESSWPFHTVPGDNMIHPWPPVLPSNGDMDTMWSSSAPHVQQYQQTQATPSDATIKWHLSPWQDSTNYEKESSSEDKGYSRICSSSESSADKIQPKSRVLDNRKRHDSNGDNQNSYPFKNRGLIEITLPDSVTGATNPEKADTNKPGSSDSSHKASIYEYQRQQFSVNNNTDEICRDPRLRVSCQKKTTKDLPKVSKEQGNSKDIHREPKRTAGLECSANKDSHENRNRSDVRASKKNTSLLLDKDTNANASNPPRENISSTDTRKTFVLSKRRGNLRAMLAQAINMTKPKSPPGSEKVTFREVGIRRSKMSINDCVSQKDANRDRSDGDSDKVSSTSQDLMKDTEEVYNNSGIRDSQSKSCLGVSVSNAVFKTEESIECVSESQNMDSLKQDIINQNRSKISFNIKHRKTFSLARAEFPLTQARKSTDISSAEGTHCNGNLKMPKEDDLSDKSEMMIHRQKLTDKLTVLEKKLAVEKEMEIEQKLPSDWYFPNCEKQTNQPQGEDFKYRDAPKTKQSEMSLSPSRHNQTRNLPLRTWYVERSSNKVDSPSKKCETGTADSDNDETLMVKEKMLMSLAEVNSLGSLSPYTDEEDDKAQDSKQDDSNQTSYYVLGKHYNNRSRVRNLEMRYQCYLDKLKYIDLFFKDEPASCPSHTSESVVSKEQEESEVLEVGQKDSKTNLHENECKSNQPCNTQPALPKENRLLSILMQEPLKSLPSSSTGKHGSRNTVKHKTQEEDDDYTQKRNFSHNSRKKRHSTQDVRQKRLRCQSCCQIISPVESKKSRRQSYPSRRELNTSSLPLYRPSLSIKESTHRRKMSPDDNSCYSCSSSTEEINSSREGSPKRCGSSPIFEDCAVTGSLNKSASLRNCSPPDQKAPLNNRHPQNSPSRHNSPPSHRSPPRHVSFTKTSSNSCSGSLCKCYLSSKYDCPSRNRISGSVSPRSESPMRQGSPHRSPSRCSLLTRHRSSSQHKLPPRSILPTRDRSPCRHRSLSSCSSTSRHGSPPSRYSWASRQSVDSQKSLSCAREPQHKSPMRRSHRSSHNVFSKHKSLRRSKSNKSRKSCKSPHWTPSNRPSPPRYTLPEHFDIASRFSPLRQTSASKHSSLQHLRESTISPPRQRTCTYKMTGKGGYSSSSRSRRSEKPTTDRGKGCHHHHHHHPPPQRSIECHSPSEDFKNRFKGKSQTDIENSSTKSLTKVLKSIQGTRDNNDTSFDAVNLDWPITEGENYLDKIICSERNRNKSKCRYHSKYAHPDHCNREEDSLPKCTSETGMQNANTFTNGLLISSKRKETLKKCSKQTTLGEEDLVHAESLPISSETKNIVDIRHDTHLSNNELKMSTTKDKDFSLLDDSSSAKQLKEVECVAEEGMPCEGRRCIDIQGEDLEITTGKEGCPIIEYAEVSCSNEEYETTNKSTKIDIGDHKNIKSDPRDMLMTVKAMDVKKHICCEIKEEALMKSMNFRDLEQKDAVCSVDKTNEHSKSLNANMSFSRVQKRNKVLEIDSKKLKKGRKRCHACYECKTEKSHLGQNARKFLNTEECYSNPTAHDVAEFDQVSMSTLEIAAADSSTNPKEKSRVTKFYEELFYLADSSEGFEKESKFFSPEIYSREEEKEGNEDASIYKVDALPYDKVDSLECKENESSVWDKENYSSVMRKRGKSTGDKVNEFLHSQQINESMAIKAVDYWAEHKSDYAKTKIVYEKVRPRKAGGSKGDKSAMPIEFYDLTERDGNDVSMRHKEICDTTKQEKVDNSTEYEEGELVEDEVDEDLQKPVEHNGQMGQEEVGKQKRHRENNELSGQEESDELKKIEDELRRLDEDGESMEEGELMEHEAGEELHKPKEYDGLARQEEIGKQKRPRESNELSGQEEADELKIEDKSRRIDEVDESTEYEEGELVEHEVGEELHKPNEYDGLMEQEEVLSGQEETDELKIEEKSRRIDEVDGSMEYKKGELMEREVGEELHKPKEYDGLTGQEGAGKRKRPGENNEMSGQEEANKLKIEDESRRIDEVDGSTGHEEGELAKREAGEELHKSKKHNELTGLEEAGKQKRSRENNKLSRQEEGELKEIEDKLKSIEEGEESLRSESDELAKEEELYEPMKFENLDKSIGHGEIKRSTITTEDDKLMAQDEISESLKSLKVDQSLHFLKRNDQSPRLNIDSVGSVDDDRSMEVKRVFAHEVKSAINKKIKKSVNDRVDYDTMSLIVCQEEIVPTPLRFGDSIVDGGELIDQDHKDSTSDAPDKSASDKGENSIQYDIEESDDHKPHTSTRQHGNDQLRGHKIEEFIEHDGESKDDFVDGLVDDKDIVLTGHYENDHLNDHKIEDSVEYVEDAKKHIVKDSVDHENDHPIGQQENGDAKDHEVHDAIGHDIEELTEQEVGKLTDHEVRNLIEVKIDDSVGQEQIRESVDQEVEASVRLKVQDSRRFREVEEPLGYEVDNPMRLEEAWDSTGHEIDPVGIQDDEPTRREETEAKTHKVYESAGVSENHQLVRHGNIESTASKVDEVTESEVDPCMEHNEVGHLLVHGADASAGYKEANQVAECEVEASIEHKGVNEMAVHVDDASTVHGEVTLSECKLHAPMEYESVERKDETSKEQKKTDKLTDQDIKKVDASTEHENFYEHEGDTILGPLKADNWTEHKDEVLSEHENLNDLMEYEVDTPEGHNAASESTELKSDQYVECEEVDRLTKRDLGMPAKFENVNELVRHEPGGLTEHDEDDKSTKHQDDTPMVYNETDRLSDHENDTSTKSRLVDILAEQENDQPREHTTTDKMMGREEIVDLRELKTDSHETPSPQFESPRTSVREDQTNLRNLTGLPEVFETRTRFDSKKQIKRGRTYKTMEPFSIPFDSENIDLRDISRECEPQQIANLSTNSRDGGSLNVEEKTTHEALLQLERDAGTENKEVETSFERNSDNTSSELCNGYNDVNDNSYDHQGFTYPSDYESDKSLPCLETLPSVSFMEPSKAGTPRSTRRRSYLNKEEFYEGSEENQNFESRGGKPQQVSDRDQGRYQQTRRRKGGSRGTSRKSSYTKKKIKDSDSYIPSRNPPSQSSVKTRSSSTVQGRYALRSTSRYKSLYGRYSPQTPDDLQGDLQNEKKQMYQEAYPKPLLQSEDGEDKENTGSQKSEDLQDPQAPRDPLNSQDRLGETLENPRQSVVDPPTKTSESVHMVSEIDNVTKEKGIPTVTVCITSRVRNHCPACGTGLILDSHTSVSLSTGNLRVKCPKCFLAIIMRGVFFQKLCQLKDPPPGPYCKTKILSPSAANPRRKQHVINRVYDHKKGCGVK